jgi:hypothetical protein
MYRQSIPIAVMPDIFNRASILGSFRMDPRLQLAGMTKGGWIPATHCGYDEKSLSCPTFLIGHPSWSFSDGYPPETAGMTEKKMDPRLLLAGMTEGERVPRWPLAGITKPQFRGSPLPMAAGAGPTIAGMTTDM